LRENRNVARATKKEKSPTDELWEEYQRIQLTPEQKAAARAEVEKRVEEARRNGVYERLLDLVGKVKWSVSWEQLRREDDDE
jgi:hypothetical protein